MVWLLLRGSTIVMVFIFSKRYPCMDGRCVTRSVYQGGEGPRSYGQFGCVMLKSVPGALLGYLVGRPGVAVWLFNVGYTDMMAVGCWCVGAGRLFPMECVVFLPIGLIDVYMLFSLGIHWRLCCSGVRL